MKKFFVGLLSVFLLLGASILTACGSNNIELTVETNTVSIQIKDESVTPEQIVVATVTGTDDTGISASAFGYEEIIDVRTESSTNGRTLIYITGKDTEGYAEVLVRTHQGNESEIITVDVYSEVSGMEQKTEETTKKNNFAIRGGSVELVENNLISFSPSENSRRTITWSLLDSTLPASIEGNILTLDQTFPQDVASIILVATTERGVTCNIELPVIDRLEEDLTMSWSYNRDNQAYELITETNNTFNIVPNLATDEEYTGYIKLNFSQALDVGYTVVTADGQVSDSLVVNAIGDDNDGNPIFEVFANKDDTNINEDFIIYFTIGYQDYNYSISTLEILPINVSVREKVNNIIVSNDTVDNIAGTTQVLYSEYLNGHGEEFNVQITPTTVVDATREYSISLRITNLNIPEGGLAAGCPVEFWYRDVNNNNFWTQVIMEYDALQDVYKTRENNNISASTIYMKAATDLTVQNFEGIEITFTSIDNDEITNVFYAELVKSVSQDDFIFADANFRVDSSSSTTDVSITKTFTLQGQTTTDGLYVITNSENVTLTQPVYISSTAESVTFAITLTLNRTSFGVTSLDSYQILHENGLESDVFDIDIFLPLKDVAINYDTGNVADSVTSIETSNISYDSDGNEIVSSMSSISRIMLKNGTTTPVLYRYNTSGSHSAVADISVSYYDFVESDTLTADVFRNLMLNSAGILSIMNAARENTDRVSNVAYFSANNNNIITTGVGLTYAVVTFTGKAADGSADINGNTSIIKIILIESYVSPDGFYINPLNDRNVSLYAANTVATRDETLTRKTITINFANAGITYATLENFNFVSTIRDASGNPVMTNKVTSGNVVSWTNGRYAIENIVITDSYITFDIATISNYGSYSFYDELELHYQLIIVDSEGNEQTIDMLWTTINITIRNAQRLTEVTWENSDEDGIYFEVGNTEPYYIVLSTSPNNARNNNVSYLITDENGGVIDDSSFVGVDNQISSNMLGVSLSERITQGMIGYIYILPEDAVYNGNIIYNYLGEDGQTQQSQVSVRALGLIREGSQTWFDYLIQEAFFLSNTSLESDATTVYFSDILLKIKITVADGSNFDYAYRIYDEEGFINLNPELYYTVMNSIEIPGSANRQPITQFNGGLQGYNDTITVSLNGSNFANTIGSSAEIRNIIFSGNVNGLGFVANENNGTLTNVTVDVYQTYSSLLSSNGTGLVGGLVGTNYGTITNSSVLGLTISAPNSTVGGLVGQNSGTISYSRVEFYNLTDRNNNENTVYSTFTGYIVGGLVGQASENSLIDHSYVYNYNIDSFTTTHISVFQGNGFKGALVGTLSGESTIYYSFAVIDNVSNYYGNVDNTISGSASENSDFYYSYYDAQDSYISTYYYEGTNNENSPNLVSTGENFHSYVNGGNKHYLNLYQEEKVTDVSSKNVQTFIDNGYYKSLQVDGNGSSYGILFYYEIISGANDLTSSEENDLNELNTISLSELVGEEITDNIIITSSNTAIVRVIGSSLNVVGTGDVVLTISSKHDVENNKVILIKVLPSFSQMIISYTDSANNTYQVQDGSTTYLQKTKTRDYIFTYENTTIILGNSGQIFELVQNNIELTSEIAILGNNMGITLEKISNSVYTVTANNVENGSTQVTFNPVITEDNIYQTAINEEFAKTFTIVPVDGVISYEYTGESLPLTPSVNAAVRVELNTTAETDKYGLVPSISYNGDRLQVVRDESLSQETEERVYIVYNYLLPQDFGTENYSLTATVSLENSSYDDVTGIYSYIFNISFSIHTNYKTQVDEDMTFNVSFISNSGSDSQNTQNGSAGSIELKLTKQQFTGIDVSNYTISRSVWTQSSGIYVTQHTKGDQTGVVSPGSSSIMQININPSFAYYDYMTLSYSGATVASAVSFELLRSNSEDNTTFIPSTGSNYYEQGNYIRFTPTAQEKELGIIYVRVAISSTVNSDSTIKFTASFYESEGNLLTSVNYYLTISYLNEPTISIDGSSVAYLALGSTAEVEIQVREDQVVDSVVLDGEGISGIYISSLTEHAADPITGIKTYTAMLTANINVDVASANKTFYIQAQVSRILNGVLEPKTTQATVVLVDFKIDQENIEIDNAENNTLEVWYGVSRTFDVTYNLLPETYNYDASDSASINKVQELNQARANFQKYQYYASYTSESLDYYTYAINYDEDGNPLQIQQRLWFVVDGEEIPIESDDYDAAVRFEFVDNEDGEVGGRYNISSQNVLVTGTRMGGSETLVLKTYISLGDNSEPTVYNTYFTINVQTYSDPDLPVTISNATEFKNLNPDNYDNNETLSAEDYILMNDIVLENYTPFSTSLISSLDGNGYTIYIKSFDLDSLGGSSVNFALFETVLSTTTLRNVRVNVYNGGQLTIDLASFSNNSNVSINVAGLAITNQGIITNCEVVSYYTEQVAMGDIVNIPATTAHNNPSGINVKFIRGANTTENIYVTQNSSFVPQIAGFVINNEGSITNSRVGGESITILGDEQTLNGSATGYTYASTLELDTFYIIGQGDMAGFVLSNSGTIAASFVKLLDMENQSNSTTYNTTGFVGTNNGKIITSYIEGVPTDESLIEEGGYSTFAYEGSSLKSRLGIIAGFVNDNQGTIQNSYSNILIANSTDTVRVYLASGFVYENSGTIEACYSASQIANSRATQMNFSGVDENGNLLALGTYTNCYFFNKRYSGDTSEDSTVESQYGTGAILISNPSMSTYFYGFAVADGESDGVWRITEDGVTLIEANLQSYSHRYAYYIDEDSGYEGATAENEEGEYIFRYAILQFTDSSREIDTALGSENNPILITDAQDFVEVMGNSTSTPIAQNYNNSVVWGSYRMVADVDLSTVNESIILPSTTKAFAGRLYANGFTISNISIASEASDDRNIAYGLFASIESRNNSVPLISNLNIEINQVVAGSSVMVGGLAGYIKDSIIVNIEITFNENSQVEGLNFAGGLAGFSFGNSVIKNIVVTNPYVIASRYSLSTQDAYFDIAKLNDTRNNISNSLNYNTSINSPVVTQLSNYSYAGSVIGFVDNFSNSARNFNINQAENYSINNIRVSGTVYVQGQVAGGIFGLTGFQTNVRDAGISITGSSSENESHIIATKYFAGGVVGQSFGALSRVYSVYDDATQESIEDSLQSFYTGNTAAERGAIDLFYLANSSYSQKYIGGIAGYVGSGLLEISYSKLNVASIVADFAGGVIGGIDLSNATSYQVRTDLFTEGTYTKYFINEVYASGDVRARQDGDSDIITAGGIIGASIGTGNRIALLAVNAVNAISNYDYQTNSYLPVTESLNISYSYKTNLILGSAFDSQEALEANEDVDSQINGLSTIEDYSSYISIIQLTTEDGSGIVPTVAFYDSYSFNSFRTTLNLFGDVDGSISLEQINGVYAIASPANFVDSSVGHTYTQQAFLSSGAWDSNHWEHATEDLFPTIRYQRTTNYIYLDAYEESIISVFERLQDANSDITVIVRGRTSAESSDSYSDIDISSLLESNTIQKINGFSGTILGSEEYVVTADPDRIGERVRIVSSQGFIESTGAGFYMDNVCILYQAGNGRDIEVDTNGNNNSGLFSTSGITEATLSNLEIEINSPVRSTVASNSSLDYNFGLLAPTITSSTLSNILITSTNTTGIRLVNIDVPNLEGDNEIDLNIGLLAGTLNQSSSISTLRVEGIEYSFNSDLLSLNKENNVSEGTNNISLTEVNIGGYFGKATRTTDALDTELTINNITKLATSTNTGNQTISIGEGLEIENLYMGGFIGNNASVNSISNYRGSSISVGIDMIIDQDVKVTGTLYAGLIFGQSTSTLESVNLNSSVIDGGLYFEQEDSNINDLFAGGFAGELRGSPTNIRNIDTVNFEIATTAVRELNINNTTEEDDISEDEFISYMSDPAQYGKNVVGIKGNANIGILVGHTNARFVFSGSSSVFTSLNENGESIRIKVPIDKELNVGSIIGLFDGVSAANSNLSTLSITNNIVSNARIVVLQGDSVTGGQTEYAVNVGGIIGSIYSSDSSTSADTTTVASQIQIGDGTQNTINFIGSVYSSVKNINFGGIVGSVNFLKEEDNITIQNGVFGGVLKVFGVTSKDVVAGGTIGTLQTGNAEFNSTNTNVTISNNYNYGDVFVEYDNINDVELSEAARENTLQKLESYTFGGLIGEISSGSTNNNPFKIVASNNYSLTTSHNARYVESENSTNNALFGTNISAESVSRSNFYSSLVTLTVDARGIDVGYTSAYVSDGYGFNDNSQNDIIAGGESNLASLIRNYTIYERDNYTNSQDHSAEIGTKLNPITLNSSTYTGNKTSTSTDTDQAEEDAENNRDNITLFNGILYYVISSSNPFTSQLNIVDGLFNTETDSDTSNVKTALTNVAIIGNGGEIEYRLDNNNREEHKSFIESLNGYSYVSGLVINLDINTENDNGDEDLTNEEKVFSGLANTMTDNTTVFAVQVKGEMNIGGTTKVDVAGLVENVSSGKIIFATTSLDITYRAGADGNVYGLAGLSSSSYKLDKFILYSYTTGSISSYIDANIYAVTAGAYNTKISNTYSIVDMTLDDYTSSDAPSGNIAVFGDDENIRDYNLEESYYDGNALDVELTIDADTKRQEKTDDLSNAISGDLLDSEYYDKGEYDFNYGYPTTKFGFMKVSSYATAGTTQPEGEEGYDSYVTSTEYTRIPNNTRPNFADSNSYYYIIPNAGVLAKIASINTNNNGRFVLWNNIDISQTYYSAESGENWTSITMNNPLIDFDGNEKTIQNLNNSLFEYLGITSGENNTETTTEVNNGRVKVRNLRLTDSTVSRKGVLAATLYNTDITNMTISGSASSSSLGVLGLGEGQDQSEVNYCVLGGLANEAYNSVISTVTNLVKIDVTNKPTENIEVGGIVGRIENSTINYCSNYGPINVNCGGSSSESTGNYYVGGIVGNTVGENNEIVYSYNATSVMANYASSSELSNVKGDYYVGGIAGYSEAAALNIKGSYNSGAIKSGNKNNGEAGDEGLEGRSYAAGIIAKGAEGANVTVDTCYNEGSIEALGASPITDFVWEMGSNKVLKMIQTNNRNVWAYAIGDIDEGEIISSQYRTTNEETVYMNGTIFDSGSTIRTWNYENEIKAQIDVSKAKMSDSAETSLFKFYLWYNYYEAIRRSLSVSTTVVEPSDGEQANVYVNAYNGFGLPVSFIISLPIRTTISYTGWYTDAHFYGWLVIGGSNWGHNPTIEVNPQVENNEYAFISCSDIYSSYLSNYLPSTNSRYISSLDSSYINCQSGSGESIKRNTRASSSSNPGTMEIAGESYYLADSNNLNTIFNSGIYVYEITAELGDIPYINDTTYYDIVATSQYQTEDGTLRDTSLDVTIQNLSSTEITFTCNSLYQLVNDIEYSIIFNYDNLLSFDSSSVNYYYIDNYSFGIEVGGVTSLQPVGIFQLTTMSGTVYNNVIKAYYTEDSENIPDIEVVGDEGEKFVYFGLTDEGYLVYAPNATLEVEGEDAPITVNIEDSITDDNGFGSGEAYVNNITTIINQKFADKSYYFSVSAQEDRLKYDISFSNVSGNAEEAISGGGSVSDSGTIDYGNSSNSWYGDITYEVSNHQYSSDINISVTNIFEPNGVVYENNSYTVSLDGNDIAIYSLEGGCWSVNNDIDSIIIEGQECTLITEQDSSTMNFVFTDLNLNSSATETLAGNLCEYLADNLKVSATQITQNTEEITNGTVNSYANISNNAIINITNKFDFTGDSVSDSYTLMLGEQELATYTNTNNPGWSETSGSITIDGISYQYTTTNIAGDLIQFTFDGIDATSIISNLTVTIGEAQEDTEIVVSDYITIEGNDVINMTNSFDFSEYIAGSSYSLMLAGQKLVTYTYTDTNNAGWNETSGSTGSITIDGGAIYSYTISIANDVITLSFDGAVLNNNLSISGTLISELVTNIENGIISDYATIASSSSTELVSADHTFTIDLNTPSADTLILNGDPNSEDILSVLLGYSESTRSWAKSSDFNTINIGGHEFSVEISNGQLVFTTTIEAVENLDVDLSAILKGYYAITNNFDEKATLEDLFTDIVSKVFTEPIKNLDGDTIGEFRGQAAVNKQYIITNNDYLVINGNTVSFKELAEYSDLKSYTLNGIRVYYGSYSFSYTESYSTNAWTQGITIFDQFVEEGDAIVFEIYIESVENGILYSGVLPYTVTSEGNINLQPLFSQTVTEGYSDIYFGVNVCSAYILSSDDTETLQLSLRRNNSDGGFSEFMVNATIDYESETQDVNIDRITFYVDGDKEISYNYTETETMQYDEDGNAIGVEIIKSYNFYDENNNLVFSYNVNDNNYSKYYQRNGEHFTTEVDGLDELIPSSEDYLLDGLINNDTIYLSNSTFTSPKSISARDILNSSYLPYIDNIQLENLIKITGENTKYLYIASDYQVIESISDEEGYENYITAVNYEWGSKYLPSYRQIEYQLNILYEDLFKFNILFETDSGLSLTENENYIITSVKSGENNYVQFIYFLNRTANRNNAYTNINIQITIKDNYSQEGPFINDSSVNDVTEPLEPLSIILTEDISFVNIAGGFTKQDNVNIIGNGYYISYFGSSFYKSLAGENTFIKDVKFLGETYSDPLFMSGVTDFEADLINIEYYGSIALFNSDNGALINYDGSADSSVDITSYVNISSVLNIYSNTNSTNISNDILLFKGISSKAIFENNGVIIATNGRDGSNGDSGTSNGASGSNGGSGSSGKNIYIFDENIEDNITWSNNGILKTGDGGNGGAGGSGYRAEDNLNVITDSLPTPGSAGRGGDRGGKGYIYLTKQDNTVRQENNLSKAGIIGLSGARGRYGLSRINLYATVGGWNYSSIGDTTFGQSQRFDATTGSNTSANGFDDIFENATTYYTLTGTYATQFPVDENGSPWTGADYDRLKY